MPKRKAKLSCVGCICKWGWKSQLEIMKTNIETMLCLCHNSLNTYPFLPHSFSKLRPNFCKNKFRYRLSTTSIKEQAVIQDISGLNHTPFISYRRADRKPTTNRSAARILPWLSTPHSASPACKSSTMVHQACKDSLLHKAGRGTGY